MKSCSKCNLDYDNSFKCCEKCGLPLTKKASNSPVNHNKISNKTKLIFSSILLLAICFSVIIFIKKDTYSKDTVLREFSNAILTKDISKLKKYIYIKNTSIKINQETLNPLFNYASENKNWISDFIKYSNDKQFNTNSDFSLVKNGKYLLFFDKYQVFVNSYNIKLNCDLNDCEISINGVEVAKSDSNNYSKILGPYLPGKYTIYSKYTGKYTYLEKKLDTTLIGEFFSSTTKDVSILMGATKVNFISEFHDANLIVNDIDTGLKISQAIDFGPINENTKFSMKKIFPWGEMKSNDTLYNNYFSNLKLSFTPNTDLSNNIMNIINEMNKSWVIASYSNDVNKITHINGKFKEKLKSDFDTKIKNKQKFQGKILSSKFDPNSLKLEYINSKYYTSIVAEEKYNSCIYPEGSTCVLKDNTNLSTYQLLYDEATNKWVVIDSSSISFYNFSDESKLFKFE